jgi:hypothetical protein
MNASLTELKTWHEGLLAENNATAIAGVLAAEGDELALFDFAENAEQTAANPDVYGVLKRYAAEQQSAGWLSPTAATKGWLESVGQDREVIGSARAGTWLHALGSVPLGRTPMR